MSVRPLLLGASTAFVLAAGLAFNSPARAAETDLDDLLELAQATPPAPPAATERRSFSPRAFCEDRVARRIGNRAYIKAKLDLKPEQMTAWNAFEKASDDASTKTKAYCATLPTEMKARPDYVERLTMEEGAMKARLASIETVKPSLTALFAALTPEQKASLDRPRGPMGGHMGGRMGGHMGGPGAGPR
ncbi:MAG: hypothetical protein EPO67_17175 [Reyranella sp.]|jgi:hypothetical protein|nr:MAG: hypothetical protein EPO67_17175 [Reyranella sp.]